MLKYPYLLERSYKFVTPDVEYVLPTIIPVRVFNKVRHLCLGLFYGAMLECFGLLKAVAVLLRAGFSFPRLC